MIFIPEINQVLLLTEDIEVDALKVQFESFGNIKAKFDQENNKSILFLPRGTELTVFSYSIKSNSYPYPGNFNAKVNSSDYNIITFKLDNKRKIRVPLVCANKMQVIPIEKKTEKFSKLKDYGFLHYAVHCIYESGLVRFNHKFDNSWITEDVKNRLNQPSGKLMKMSAYAVPKQVSMIEHSLYECGSSQVDTKKYKDQDNLIHREFKFKNINLELKFTCSSDDTRIIKLDIV